MSVTVVTAFYPIKSKFPPEQYLAWSQRFLQLNAPIVLFTEPHLVETFRNMRSFLPIHIVARPFKDLSMWIQYESEWRKQHTQDPEAAYHTPELYAIWAQKSAFVAEVVAENPFHTECFYWCDIGAFRDPHIRASILTTFPKASLLKTLSPAILLNSVAPLEEAEGHRCADGIFGDFTHVNRIVGGLWGGSAAACVRWHAAYEAQLIQYFAAGRFAGKDQSVMLSAYLEDPSLAVIAKPTTREGDHWFFQQYLLTDAAPFEQDVSYSNVGPPPPAPVTIRLMGGLGNQFFQIATAYAYARQHGGRLLLAPKKEEADGRPLYWTTALSRFQHVLASAPFLIKPSYWEVGATEYTPLPPPSSLGMRLQGYFQSPRYFSDSNSNSNIAKELRGLFAPTADVLTKIRSTYATLLEMRDRVVIVHARRGDYLKAVEHHGVLGLEYYQAAMIRMVKDCPQPHFVLVMDEPLWWMEVLPHLPLLQTHSFEILVESDEVVTMGLLQQFQHFILANSSFSWWAAWLADAAHVIAPQQWFGPAGPKRWEDIYMPHWVRI